MRVTQKESSRDRLLVAARELFAEHGFEAATTAALARRANTSQSQLLKYFKDKNGLLAAVLNAGWKEINSAIRLATARISTPTDQLRLILDMLLNYFEVNREFGRVFLREGERILDAEAGVHEFNKLVDGVFEWMMGIGELPSRVSPYALRVGLMGALKAMLRERALSTQSIAKFSESEMRMVFSNFMSSCMRTPEGIAPPEITVEQKEEEPWLNYYLELADMAFRAPVKGGHA